MATRKPLRGINGFEPDSQGLSTGFWPLKGVWFIQLGFRSLGGTSTVLEVTFSSNLEGGTGFLR